MYITPYSPIPSLMRELWEPLSHGGERRLTPAADALERDSEWVFRVDLPGIKKSDIDIQLEGDHLVISGTLRDHSKEEKDQQGLYTLSERVTEGTYTRHFMLPDTANPNKINATMQDGVLEVHIEKQAQVKSRKIAVD